MILETIYVFNEVESPLMLLWFESLQHFVSVPYKFPFEHQKKANEIEELTF